MTLHERQLVKPTVRLARLVAGQQDEISGVTEFLASDYFSAIETSGFPALQGQPARLIRSQLDAYLQRIVSCGCEINFRVRLSISW
ncbi:hypothetical protein [Microlunatus speluncae]|uniref:hypothetical protein n=1 Tax=Microlunatus speluncae TaxID=2594267 RepID=UPI0012664B6B|nr:hypothetical protein [Microlunatus speluncae]